MFFPSKSVSADLAIENAVGRNVITMVFEMSFNLNLKNKQHLHFKRCFYQLRSGMCYLVGVPGNFKLFFNNG